VRTLLIAPHADDETLYAAYTCLREKPHVIVCTYRDSGEELLAAMEVLGCDFTQLVFAEGALSHHPLRHWLKLEREFGTDPEVVYAPNYHDDGHWEHNIAALAARDVFGSRVRSYLTYAPRGRRQREGTEVKPEPWMIARKLAALACYASQIEQESTRPWFYDLLDMKEWVS
jgi:LmbE family N-acetylglucosaminyl deacetylase